jgi:competence protein ComEC
VKDDDLSIPPAAAPLIAIVAAIGCAPAIQDPERTAALLVVAAAGFLLLVRLPGRHRIAIVAIVLSVAILRAGHAAKRSRDVNRLTAHLEEKSFVTAIGPIDRMWRFNGRSYTLLVARFRLQEEIGNSAAASPASGRDNTLSVDEPLLVVSSSTPPAVGDATEIVARGFLARTDEGLRILSVKSTRLISYRGRLSRLDLRALNRRLFRTAEEYARRHPDRLESVALAAALALGRSELLTDDLRESYRRGGTYHFLVFSGLQVAAAGAAIALLGRRRGKPRPVNWLLLALAAGIVAFAGATPPITRACAGLAIFSLSRILERPTPLANLLLVTAAAQLLMRPSLATDAGFQLTYAGAGAVVLAAQPMIRQWSIRARVAKVMLAAAVAELSVTPLTLFHFHQYSLGGPVLLLLLAPVVALMLLVSAAALSAICLLPGAAPPLLASIGALERLCLFANSAVRGPLHLSGFAMAPTPAVMIACYGAAILTVAAAPPRIRAPLMVAAFVLPILLTSIRARELGTVPGARLEALDVGQGDAILLRAGKSAMLLDGGGRSDDWRFGERRLLPMLLDRGIRHLDVVALSHAHPDHCGGLPAVIAEIPVSAVWLSPRRLRGPCAQEILAACQRSAVPIHLVLHAEDGTAGSIPLTVLPQGRNFRRSAENNSSVVYVASLARRRVLLTGDIEREAEEALLRSRAFVQADVLKVAHHGSRTSSTAAFLRQVGPRLAVISCGYRNSFGHPHTDVLENLTSLHINTLRTDLSGTIRIDFSAGRMFPVRQFDTPR